MKAFEKQLKAAGAEILGPTNPYELLRFKTSLGVGVVYKGRKGITWNDQALAAKEHLRKGKGSLAPVKINGRRRNKATVQAIIERDGTDCFFCGEALGDDVTVEHLVSICHGGPNHISNTFLAHGECNRKAGHLSAPEKIAIAIEARR